MKKIFLAALTAMALCSYSYAQDDDDEYEEDEAPAASSAPAPAPAPAASESSAKAAPAQSGAGFMGLGIDIQETFAGATNQFYLTFKIMDDAESGDYEVKLSLKDDLDGSFADADGEAIPYSAEIGKVTVVKDVPPPDPDPDPKPNPFIDVVEGKFYYDPVLWAFYHDPVVTTGVDSTHFAPDRICTRAHVVAFLWRANGCPEPQSLTSSFKDVKDTNKYYYKAVLWAAEQGITTGYSDGTFRPDDECTRGQVVTFLWRANGSPAPTSTTNPFSDVVNGKYYTTAVLWAVEQGITQGRTSTTFGPDDSCTRGHVVTFLYRAYAD